MIHRVGLHARALVLALGLAWGAMMVRAASAPEPWAPGALPVGKSAGTPPGAAPAQPVTLAEAWCEPPPVPGVPREQTPATRRMTERLRVIRERADPRESAFLSRELVGLLSAQLRRATNLQQALFLQHQLAAQRLQAGDAEAALRTLAAFEQNLAQHGAELTPEMAVNLRLFKGLAHLRLGEQENCLSNFTTASCLLPIRGEGVHRLQRGSRAALREFTALLERAPEDLRARWLLNIAAMTLGEYPHGVPAAWRMDPKTFESEHPLPRFPDVAGELGLDVNDLAGGVVAEDFDNDGDLDLMVSSWGLGGQLRYFVNNGDGTFTQRTAEAGLVGLVSGLNLVQADYNNDGFPDVLVLRGAWLGAAGRHPNSLLRNNGDGTFDDVTEEAGLLSFHPTQTAAWFDFDGDGWLDLFIGNEGWETERHPCELYRNNGDGTFTEMAAAAGLAVNAFIKGVATGDFNNDGRPDLYLSNRSGPNRLFRNDGPGPDGQWRFTDVTAQAGVAEPRHSFPTWFFDYDNDGHEDLLVTGYAIRHVGDVAADHLGLPHPAERARLYRNRGDGTFEDVSRAAGLDRVIHAMGANYGDLDGDGWLDAYFATGDPDLTTLIPNRMFRNDGGRYFQDVTTAGGFGHLQKGHGVAFGDFDNDGDQDIYAVMGGAYSGDVYRNALFLNPGHGRRWLTLKLEGVKSNRAAIGARLRVVVTQADGAERSVHRTVSSGGSFGASTLRQEIGLGDAQAIRRVEVFWPASGIRQTLEGLELDRFYRVREGEPTARPWKLEPIPLAARPETVAKPAIAGRRP